MPTLCANPMFFLPQKKLVSVATPTSQSSKCANPSTVLTFSIKFDHPEILYSCQFWRETAVETGHIVDYAS